MGMKCNTLFEHKESTVTCEETMADVEKFLKIVKTTKKTKDKTKHHFE
jgi:SUMO ligase MMS21 Smc5/6 complex component